MLKIASSMHHIRLMDDLARQDTAIHHLHPLAKLITTIVFLVMVLSFGRLDTSAILPFFCFPVYLMIFADIPWKILAGRLLVIEPLVLSIGLVNSLFDVQPIQIGRWTIARGWLALASILIKSALTISVSLLLIMTTGIEKLAVALRLMRVPRLFILQLLLTYRYITVLAEELSRMMRAYFLRAPGQKGIRRDIWGVFSGQLLIRTFDRAERVYQAMKLRGYAGEFHTGTMKDFGIQDFLYVTGWMLFFLLMRIVDLPHWLGSLVV